MGVPVVEILTQRGHEVFVTSRKKRESINPHIHYLTGNAAEMDFICTILQEHFDSIIDFMVYNSSDFKRRLDLFLQSTGQYVFLSSARVYDNEPNDRISENSPRLLDTVHDKEYKKTDEYALAKAREENLLYQSGRKNWTIIRPYITYNVERLQLGVLEKENWLQRAVNGKAIVFSRDIAEKYTTLTYGYDVSLRIADLVGMEQALGEVFHITTSQNIRWTRVLEIYLDVLTKELGKRPSIYWLENSNMISQIFHNEYQIVYDRLFDRRFDNRKVQEITGEQQPFKDVEIGLHECLTQFLRENRNFLNRGWLSEGSLDRLTGDKTSLSEISGWKNKVKYLISRYFPPFVLKIAQAFK